MNYFLKRDEKLVNKDEKELANGRMEDKSEVIRKMDEDLLPNGWEKHEEDTHVTYTRELSDSVSEVFRRYER